MKALSNGNRKYSTFILGLLLICMSTISAFSPVGMIAGSNEDPVSSGCDDFIFITNGHLDSWYYNETANRTGDSWENAYIISNVKLNDSSRYIYFFYTNRYVIIQDSDFDRMNGQSGYIEPLLKLIGSSNIRFQNCTFYENDICMRMDGCANIEIRNSRFIENAYPIQMDNCVGCNITGNLFDSNYHAVEMYGYTRNTTIYCNNFTDNIAISYVSCEGPNNVWDNGTLGNYYSDYDVLYPEASFDFKNRALEGYNSEAIPNDQIYGLGSEPYGDDNYPFFMFDLDLTLEINNPTETSEYKMVPTIQIEYEEMFMNVTYLLQDSLGAKSDVYDYPNQVQSADWDALQEGGITLMVNASTVIDTLITREVSIVKNTLGAEFTYTNDEFSSNPLEIQITPIDPIESVELNITGIAVEVIPSLSAFTAYIPEMIWNSLSEGDHAVSICSIDSIGNTLTKVAQFHKDTIKPTIAESNLTLSISDVNLNYSRVEVTRLSTMETDIYSDVEHLNLTSKIGEGLYMIKVNARDRAGNHNTFIKTIGSQPEEETLLWHLIGWIMTGIALITSIAVLIRSKIKEDK